MFIKQISVFVENTQGSLSRITQVLSEHDIDLIALSIADTKDFGILRGIVSDTEKAHEVVREAGYTVSLTDVLAVRVADTPGGLSQVLSLLSGQGISVEYLYSFVRQSGQHALVIFRVENPRHAYDILTGAGIAVLDDAQVRAL